ncbi:hypothetical protein [Trujillonella humicola]|uniref:hypothetical protein n=1 Tax=Trujillonella humicola TaxID=3383699 RepID=UPI0039061548
MIPEGLLERAAELKGQLMEHARRPRYDRAFREMLAGSGEPGDVLDENQLMLLWDSFLLEHRQRDGRTLVDHFVDAHPDLPPDDRQMVLGWRDVVSGVFEVQRRDRDAVLLVNLVDDLTYRAHSTVGPSVFRQMPRRSFLLTRLVAVADEWTFSGPTTVLRPGDRDAAARAAIDLSLRSPAAVFRNPAKLTQAWELQREERQRFIRFFGADLVVVPGGQAQRRLDDFHAFRQAEVVRERPQPPRGVPRPPARVLELPPELVESDTVALVYDEDDGLGFFADFGLVEEAFADPELLRRRRYREQVLSYLHDDSVSPTVLRRLAERDPARASAVFRRLLQRRSFDWARDGEELLRSVRPDYFAQPRLPSVTPVGELLASYTGHR